MWVYRVRTMQVPLGGLERLAMDSHETTGLIHDPT